MARGSSCVAKPPRVPGPRSRASSPSRSEHLAPTANAALLRVLAGTGTRLHVRRETPGRRRRHPSLGCWARTALGRDVGATLATPLCVSALL